LFSGESGCNIKGQTEPHAEAPGRDSATAPVSHMAAEASRIHT